MKCAVLLLSILPLVSCATMSSGRMETIDIRSTPDAANASMVCAGQPAGSGVTPTKIAIRRNAGDCTVTLTKEGFEDVTMLIEQGVNPAYWMNMVFTPFGPFGVVLLANGNQGEKFIGLGLLTAGFAILSTDFFTGAVHTHRPYKVDVVLKPKPPA